MKNTNEEILNAKKELGKLIFQSRKNVMSQRKLARGIDIPPSNMKYIEDGVNAPTADVYEKILEILQPPPLIRKQMDSYYMEIRHTPPPDVCKKIINDPNLLEAIQEITTKQLTMEQADRVKILFRSFAEYTF